MKKIAKKDHFFFTSPGRGFGPKSKIRIPTGTWGSPEHAKIFRFSKFPLQIHFLSVTKKRSYPPLAKSELRPNFQTKIPRELKLWRIFGLGPWTSQPKFKPNRKRRFCSRSICRSRHRDSSHIKGEGCDIEDDVNIELDCSLPQTVALRK